MEFCEKYNDFAKWIIYQIYPRSFYDSNNDGIGDLNGIIQKFDYLKDLGINAIWICPCFKSPNVDNGYDISDYCDIMDEFGTLDDMKNLITQAHSRDIKVILDLVPNHTSSQHKWFLESKKSRNNPYSDYYYWFDEPRNNWKACFGGSAWEYCKERDQYYLHSFAVEQPDLNWTNPKVVKEMQDIVDFWVDLGVDGFRCDVIDNISKDFDGNKFLGPHLHEYINALFGRENVSHIFTVGECCTTTFDEIYKHTAASRNELTTLFQFDHLSKGREGRYIPKKDSLRVVRDIIVNWQTLSNNNGLLHSLFTDNHDQPQYISRMCDTKTYRYESATCMAAMFYLLKGVPFIYQGQEIGMVTAKYDSIDYFDDIESVNYYNDAIGNGTIDVETGLKQMNFGSRDNTRHPMCWNGEKYGGFSNVEPWLVTHSEYKNINLEKDKNSDKSVFKFYKKLLALRSNSPEILYGEFNVLSRREDNYFVFERDYKQSKITVIINFEENSVIKVPENAELLLNNYENNSNEFKPYEIRVLKEII